MDKINLEISSKKKNRVIVLFFIILSIGMLTGNVRLAGRMAMSNVFQIMGFVIILPVALKYLRNKDYIFIIGYILSSLFANLYVFSRYLVKPNITHFIFFLINIFTIIFFLRYSEKVKEVKFLITTYKVGILILIVYLLFQMVVEYFIEHHGYLSFGFDDKSHAVMICSFGAFFCLRWFKSIFRYILSAVFVILSLLTASKLAIVFVLFWGIALFLTRKQLSRIIRNNTDGLGLLRFYISVLLLISIIFGLLFFFYKNSDSFYIFDRLRDDNLSSGEISGSTESHLLLIWYGLESKFKDIVTFLFGIGPGNFSNFIFSNMSNIDYSKFQFLDPTGFVAISQGRMPMHSVHFSILSEFPIFIFVSYVWLFVSILKESICKKEYIMVLFFLSFIITTTFYSTHNEMIYYFIVLYFVITSFTKGKLKYN
ncbi:hypothetical protein ABXM06_10920 [Enterococcus faecium]|uniref:hypothetical protein n=1 Tax=Enterococcus faecium TaxID=1352 RepID=UPI000CFD03AE|nr:hypothetical protein [Enterococcus faecium]MCD5043055.1 hypothetical protein [Enterococcus faecium]MCV3115649.1 hypothetical protein [Enterococcus faecium]MDT2272169.1 hypothetical protein [Enterococcus faecium]MDT2407330.1 hypothetical protein [Enterococcus faecium]PQV96529.1 hypothetical protein CWC50_10595 [Enterococcus faecium]